MSPIRVTWARTVAQLAKSRSTAFAFAVFMAAVAALLAFNLEASDGSSLSLGAVWAFSLSPVLPVLAVLVSRTEREYQNKNETDYRNRKQKEVQNVTPRGNRFVFYKSEKLHSCRLLSKINSLISAYLTK